MKRMVETKHDLLTSNYTQVFEEANPQTYAPITPDTNKSVPADESQRPVMPEEDKRRLRAMRGPKCIPDVLRQVLGEATKDHVDTPSEKLVKVAKERDILFDKWAVASSRPLGCG